GAWPMDRSVAGFGTSYVRPPVGSTQLPPIRSRSKSQRVSACAIVAMSRNLPPRAGPRVAREFAGRRPGESSRASRDRLGNAIVLRLRSRSEKEAGAMRMLHTMIRVNDLERSLAFYPGPLGMELRRRHDFPGGRFTLAFVGYGDESSNTVLELTHNWDTKSYDVGNGFGHVALGVEDIYATCDRLRAQGVKVVREP